VQEVLNIHRGRLGTSINEMAHQTLSATSAFTFAKLGDSRDSDPPIMSLSLLPHFAVPQGINEVLRGASSETVSAPSQYQIFLSGDLVPYLLSQWLFNQNVIFW
jgi:hypothetical protein